MRPKNFTRSLTNILLSSSLILPSCESLAIDENKADGIVNRYALIICGDNEARFVIDASVLYNVLKYSDFEEKNIYVLDGGLGGNYVSRGIANKKNIHGLLTKLGGEIDSDDFFLVHITNHGTLLDVEDEKNQGTKKVISAAVLDVANEKMDENEFKDYLSNVKPGVGMVTTTMCYGGGFAKIIGKGRYVGISSSTDSQWAYMSSIQSFCGKFYEAPMEADLNGDKRLTLNERFEWAKKEDPVAREGIATPWMISDLDVGQICLSN